MTIWYKIRSFDTRLEAATDITKHVAQRLRENIFLDFIEIMKQMPKKIYKISIALGNI